MRNRDARGALSGRGMIRIIGFDPGVALREVRDALREAVRAGIWRTARRRKRRA